VHRSPGYPFISLPKAIERAKMLYDSEGRHAVRFEVAVGHWGYKPASSGALQTVAALKQFGLIKVEEGVGSERQLRLTDNAIKILLDTRDGIKEKALSEAAFSPKLYADLRRKWGGDLPSDANMASYLTVDLSFNPSSVTSVLAAYKETLALVEEQASDTLSDVDADKNEPTNTGEEDMNTETQQNQKHDTLVQHLPQARGEEEHLRAKLAGGRTVRVLFQGSPPTRTEIQKLITLLKCSEDQYPPAESKGTDGQGGTST
jgi:hypothetical protein